MKEALEEAGLHGQIVGEPLGSFDDAKWGCRLLVTVLLMEVSRCDETWHESDVRQRCWASPERAAELISKPVLRCFVEQAATRVLEG